MNTQDTQQGIDSISKPQTQEERIETIFESLDFKPSERVISLLNSSPGNITEDIKRLLELPGWPLVDKLLKGSNSKRYKEIIGVSFSDSGICELALRDSTVMRIVTFSDTEIIDDTSRYFGGIAKMNSGERQPQSGIDGLEDRNHGILSLVDIVDTGL